MITGTQAKKILKAAGIDSRKILAQTPRGSLQVKLLDLSLDAEKVYQILKPYEVVYRDKASGELLEAQHFFVFVDYAYNLKPTEVQLDQFQLAWTELHESPAWMETYQRQFIVSRLMKATGMSQLQSSEVYRVCQRELLNR